MFMLVLWIDILLQLIKFEPLSPLRFLFMFASVMLHELGHSALMWYGKGACDNSHLGGIEQEVGEYIELISHFD